MEDKKETDYGVVMTCERCGQQFTTTAFSPYFVNVCCPECFVIYGRDGGGDDE